MQISKFELCLNILLFAFQNVKMVFLQLEVMPGELAVNSPSSIKAWLTGHAQMKMLPRNGVL